MARTPCIMIAGCGRSGSNRLLQIFDRHPATACRNEPDEIAGSEFHPIAKDVAAGTLGPAEVAALRRAIDRAGVRRSERDPLDRVDKHYLSAFGRRLLPAMHYTRLRRGAARIGLVSDPREWSLPAAFLAADRVDSIVPVVKLNARPDWADALAGHEGGRPVRVVHNIRAPEGYLKSWYNRFMTGPDGAAEYRRNFDDVPRILAHYGRDDAERLREPTTENTVEVELWRWRYVNEQLLALEARTDAYHRVTYREVQDDPAGAARGLLAFAGLDGAGDAAREAEGLENRLFARGHHTTLDADLCARLIDEVLSDSPLPDLLGKAPAPLRAAG